MSMVALGTPTLGPQAPERERPIRNLLYLSVHLSVHLSQARENKAEMNNKEELEEEEIV